MPKTTTHPSSNSSPVSPKKQKELPTLDLPIGEEILDEEMKFAEMDLPQIDYPEIENYSDEDLKWSMTTNVWKEIQQALDEDARLDYLAERIVKDWKEHPFSKLLSHIQERAEKVDRNALFDEGGSEVVTKTNEPLVLALVERLLWNIGRKHSLPDSERAELLSYRFEKIKDQKNPMEIVQAFYPKLEQEAMSQTKKLEILTKVSILMMILPVPKVDEFIERNIFIDKMLQWADFKTTVDYTLESSLQFEIKNHGINYNYRIEEFINFLENAKNLVINKPRWVKWVKEAVFSVAEWRGPSVLSNYQWRYKQVGSVLRKMQTLGASDREIYVAYALCSRLYMHSAVSKQRRHSGNYTYLSEFESLPLSTLNPKSTFFFLLRNYKEIPRIIVNFNEYNIVRELRRMGVSIQEIREKTNVGAQILLDWFVGMNEMFKAWITLKEMVDEWIKPQQLHKLWTTYQHQIEEGITLEEMYNKGVTLRELFEGWVSRERIESELFTSYPTKVIESLRKECNNTDTMGKMIAYGDENFKEAQDITNKMYFEELEKLKKIKFQPHIYNNWEQFIHSTNDALIVWGKTFYVFKPQKQKDDIDAPGAMNDQRFIKWTIVEKVVKRSWMHLFKSSQEATEFIREHIPGSTDRAKMTNFLKLLWVNTGCYNYSTDTRSPAGWRGWVCAWVTKLKEWWVWMLMVSDDFWDMNAKNGNLKHFAIVICHEKTKNRQIEAIWTSATGPK